MTIQFNGTKFYLVKQGIWTARELNKKGVPLNHCHDYVRRGKGDWQRRQSGVKAPPDLITEFEVAIFQQVTRFVHERDNSNGNRRHVNLNTQRDVFRTPRESKRAHDD